MISTDGNAPGLIDNNTFTGNAAAEMIHNLGMGAVIRADGLTCHAGKCECPLCEDNISPIMRAVIPHTFGHICYSGVLRRENRLQA